MRYSTFPLLILYILAFCEPIFCPVYCWITVGLRLLLQTVIHFKTSQNALSKDCILKTKALRGNIMHDTATQNRTFMWSVFMERISPLALPSSQNPTFCTNTTTHKIKCTMHRFSQYIFNMAIHFCLGGIFYPSVQRHMTMLSLIVDSLMHQKTMVTQTIHSTYLIQLSYRFLKFIEMEGRGLKVALSIEGGGEGSVVQCSWRCSMAGVRWHPHDAILCLFRRKFSP